MKPAHLLLLGALAFCSCTTLENRRDLYTTAEVEGPYTRMLKPKFMNPFAKKETGQAVVVYEGQQPSGK
jgi:hypothetical protein